MFILDAKHVTLIIDSMRQMESQTKVDDVPCIQFRPKTDADQIYITIQNGTGCSAYVNKKINRIKIKRLKLFLF